MVSSAFRNIIASSVVVAIVLSTTAPQAVAGDTAVLTGRVLPSADGRLTAKTVWVGAVPAPVAADGTFRVGGLPEGRTDLAVETSEGLYVVDTPLVLAPGTARSLQLALRGRQDTGTAKPPEKEKKRKHNGALDNPLTGTLIIVGSAIVLGVAIDQLTNSKNPTASQSSPSN